MVVSPLIAPMKDQVATQCSLRIKQFEPPEPWLWYGNTTPLRRRGSVKDYSARMYKEHMSRRRRQRSGTAFDLFSSFQKRSVRDSTSFLAKPLSRCGLYTRSISTYPRIWLSSLDKHNVCCYRPLSGPFGLALLILVRLFAASVRARKVGSATLVIWSIT